MMHIAVNGWFWDQPQVGSGQYLRRLLHALRKVEPGLKLTLILPAHNPRPEDVPDGIEVRVAGNARLPENPGKVWFEQYAFPRAAGEAKADLAHIPYWGAPLTCPVKVVTSVLDVIPLIYPLYSAGIARRLYTSLAVASAKGSDHIITLSESSKLDIENHLRIPDERISVTYLAPDEIYHPKIGAERDEQVRRKYDLPDQYILYLGGFDARKRVNELLLAYTYVSEAEGDNLPLVLAGKEPEWGKSPLFPDLREYVARLAITDYIHWIGAVEEADKPALYRMAEVFVSPSEYEGFGLPPLEAMACGTPTVVADIDVFDEILESGAYLVNNPREMAGAIIALVLQQPFRETMINQGLALTTKYSWRKTAEQTLVIYKRILEDN